MTENATPKVTNKDRYAEMAAILNELGHADLADFCNAQIAALEAKAAKAKERAAKKAETPDELAILVSGALTEEFQTAADIFAAVEGELEDITIGKVRARLTALVHDGAVEKTDVKVEEDGKTRTVKGYRFVA